MLAFIDKVHGGQYHDVPIDSLENIKKYEYDMILISLEDYGKVSEIKRELIERGIETEKIDSLMHNPIYIDLYSDQRMDYIKYLATYFTEKRLREMWRNVEFLRVIPRSL